MRKAHAFFGLLVAWLLVCGASAQSFTCAPSDDPVVCSALSIFYDKRHVMKHGHVLGSFWRHERVGAAVQHLEAGQALARHIAHHMASERVREYPGNTAPKSGKSKGQGVAGQRGRGCAASEASPRVAPRLVAPNGWLRYTARARAVAAVAGRRAPAHWAVRRPPRAPPAGGASGRCESAPRAPRAAAAPRTAAW